MNYTIDLSLFNGLSHNPSLGSLKENLGDKANELIDFCIPVNPYFPTPEMFASFRDRLESTLKFYPGYNKDIAAILSRLTNVDPNCLVMGNGSTELITWINLLFVKETLAIPIPTFSRWTDDPLSTGKTVHMMPRLEENRFQITVEDYVSFIRKTRSRTAVICNPNNPTGAFLPVEDLAKWMDALSDLDLLVIDESFVDFVYEDYVPTVVEEALKRENVLVLKSLGKNFGLHGVRAGYAVVNPRLAKRLQKALPYWNLNAMAELLIRELSSHLTAYEAGRQQVVRDRKTLERHLSRIEGITVFPSYANFAFVKMPSDVDGTALRNHLLTEYGLFTRECGNKIGSDSRFFRFAARPEKDSLRLVSALEKSIAEFRSRCAEAC